MLRKIIRTTAIVGALTVMAGAAQADIINAGFETGALAPWYQGNEYNNGAFEAWNVTSADAHSGAYSATGTNNVEIRQDFAPILTDNILELSFYAKHIGAGSALAYTFYYNDGSSNQPAVNVPEGAWMAFDVTANLTAGKMLTGFSIYGNSNGCPGQTCTRTFLDDVVLRTSAVDVPEPASLALFGFGMIGLAAVRRRKS